MAGQILPKVKVFWNPAVKMGLQNCLRNLFVEKKISALQNLSYHVFLASKGVFIFRKPSTFPWTSMCDACLQAKRLEHLPCLQSGIMRRIWLVTQIIILVHLWRLFGIFPIVRMFVWYLQFVAGLNIYWWFYSYLFTLSSCILFFDKKRNRNIFLLSFTL